MSKSKVYIYFGSNEAAAGFIYHKKQAEFECAGFINLAQRNSIFGILGKVLCHPKYCGCVNRFLLATLFDHVLKAMIAVTMLPFFTVKQSKICVVSNDYVSIYLGIMMGRIRNKNLHLSCHDLPWTFFKSRGSKVIIINLYRHILKHFGTFDFTSNYMRRFFAKLYNIKIDRYAITHSGIDVVNCKNLDDHVIVDLNKNKIKLLYLGNIRFIKELDDLIFYLEEHDLRYSIDLYSAINPRNEKVNYKGFLKNVGDIEFSKYDFGIVPLSMQPHQRMLVKSSFPSKAAVYVSYSLPILTVIPTYSPLNGIIARYPIGISVDRLEKGVKYCFNLRPYQDFLRDGHHSLSSL